MLVALRRMTFLPSRTAIAGVLLGLIGGVPMASAGNFVEPTVFASSRGVLDLLMIAKTKPVTTIALPSPEGDINPTGWVYEICRRPAYGNANQCPAGSAVADYGGVRLALQKGDTLKIRLVNRLPLIDAAKLSHSTDPGEGNLFLNPTNLHTHGLIVQPRAPTLYDQTFGDYVFVQIFNSANGMPVPQTTHQHGQNKMDYVDYRIDIPYNHPSGQFWFHPHIHGLSLNQVSAGLAGIISVGEVGDYAHGDAMDTPFSAASVRHMILKDIQVLPATTVQFANGPAQVQAGEVLNQEDPGFCAQFPADASEQRQGYCPGADNSADDGGSNFVGGRWFFTVNGQQFPTIKLSDPDGEVWRLTNASGSLSYDLRLVDDTTQKPMVMQLLAVDGVSVSLPQDTPMNTMVHLGGARFRVVACPPAPSIGFHSLPLCVSELVMMPSSRAELWVSYRNSSGALATAPKSTTATFKMVGLTMGSGDTWPAVDLAKVEFAQPNRRGHISYAMNIRGDALATMQPSGILEGQVPYANAAPLPAGCKALPEGHRRRIFFGLEDLNDGASFGLGYEEVDQNGKPVPGTQIPVTRFDPATNIVCLPLGPGQRPVHEIWELVQLSTENHNFHMHQTRFRSVESSAPSNSPLALKLNPSVGGGIVQDNVELGVATPNIPDVMDTQNGVCSIDQWRNGQCTSAARLVDIPFSQVGEFVYHCHILEHEDGGMMAKIQVVPAPSWPRQWSWNSWNPWNSWNRWD
jgi:L-ascorbate oxidase